MTGENNLDISRRKVLAGLGTVGVASAGAGMGTSAFFSDTENFDGNQLTAGELDLKMDWEEHYSDWSDDENVDRTDDEGGDEGPEGPNEFEVLMEAPPSGEEDDYLGFPPGAGSPLIWVPNQYVDDFMRNTSIDAYPDENDDGIGEFPIEEMMPDKRPCDVLADVGGENDNGLDPDKSGLSRTDNDDTRDENGNPAPLIALRDVKPGDFGEITFSTHLCDNDGYLWMNSPGGLTENENGMTEPEEEDPDESGVLEDGSNPGELAENVQTAIWYDSNCDNLVTDGEPIDLIALADTSASIGGSLSNTDDTEEIDLLRDAANVFVNDLLSIDADGDLIQAGFMTFNGESDAGDAAQKPILRKGLGPVSQFDTDGDGDADVGDFLPDQGGGNTPMPHALDLARKVLNDQGRGDDARQVILLVTDGLPDYTDDTSYTVEDPDTGDTYTSDTYPDGNTGTSSQQERDETAQVADDIKGQEIDILAAGIGLENLDTDVDGDTFLECRVVGLMPSPNTCEPDQFFDTDFDNLDQTAQEIAQQLLGGQSNGDGDEIIFTGTLEQAIAELTGGLGIPLDGDRSTAYDELNDPPDDPDRECFRASNTHCFGFSWWLPVDHANEIQTDSAEFDIGFYTEQCRHNDGSGQPAET